jgi:hypothetical protein
VYDRFSVADFNTPPSNSPTQMKFRKRHSRHDDLSSFTQARASILGLLSGLLTSVIWWPRSASWVRIPTEACVELEALPKRLK